MAVARVGSAAFSSASAASVSASLPQTPTAGNYLLMGVYALGTSATQPVISTPSGWTAGPQGGTNNATNYGTVALFYKVAGASETAPTVTSSSTSQILVGVEEWSGVAGVDAQSTVASFNATTACTNTVSTSQAGDLVWSVFGQDTNTATAPSVTWSGGSSQDALNYFSAGNLLLTFGTQTPSTATSVSPSCANSTANAAGSPNSMGTIAFKATSSGGGSTTYNHTIPAQYTTATQVTAPNLYALSATASGTSATKASFGTLQVQANYVAFQPNVTNSTNSTTAPASTVAWDSVGWQMDQPIVGNTTDTGAIQAGSVTLSVNITSSAALTGTIIGYLYVGGVQIGTGTSASTAFGTSAITITVPITISAASIPANGRLQMKLYVSGTNTALSATTVTLNFGTATVVPASIKFNTQATRTPTDTFTGTDTTVRAFTGTRAKTDGNTGTDALTRAAVFPRAASDARTSSDVAARIFAALRTPTETATGTDATSRMTVGSRSVTDTALTSESAARALIYGRFTDDGGDIVRYPTKSITGVTRDQAGNILGGCTVYLLRESDGLIVRTTTSDATTGVYSFARDIADSRSYTVFDRKPSAMVQGISPAGNVPA